MKPFVIEKTFQAPVQLVWEAISNKDRMKQWYFTLAEFRAEPGFTFSFIAGPEGKPYRHLCRITAVIPLRKLSYTWCYEGYLGDSEVIFELFPEGEHTHQVLTHRGLENFAQNGNPDLASENFAMGWTQIIGNSLMGYLENHAKETQ